MRVLLHFLIFLFVFISFGYGADYRAVLVADIDTGKILYQENAEQLNYPASLTKIMTLYLTFDALEHNRLHLDDYLIISQYAVNAQPVKLGLTAGSKIKVEDAIKAVAVHSANDVARVLAENLQGGKEGNFANLMTDVATQIGLEHTNFENSSGLPNDDHMSTARDIALISMAVYKHFPQYWKYFGIKTWNYNGKTYTNSNRLLGAYPGCDGMKTGYTNKSKYSLVATATRNNKHLLAVVLGAKNKEVRAAVAAKMLDKGFGVVSGYDTYKEYEVQKEQEETDEEYRESISSLNPIMKYVDDSESIKGNKVKIKPKTQVVKAGNMGIQVGAFSNYESADRHIQRIYELTGIKADISNTIKNGKELYRVRITDISSDTANRVQGILTDNGIDSFIFH